MVRKFFCKVYGSTLVKSSGIYTIVNFLNKVFPFILLPILSRELSLEEFGEFSIYRTSISFCIPLVGLSLSEFIIRKFFENLNVHYISTIIIQVIANSIILLTISLFYSEFILTLMGMDSIMFSSAIIIALSTCVNNIHRGILRCVNNNSFFAVLVLGQSILYFLVIFCSYWFFGISLFLAVIVEVIVFVIFSSVSVYLLYRKYGFSLKFKKSYLKEGLNYSSPLFLNSIMIYSFALLDRYIINYQLGSQDVALYVGVFQLASIFQVLGSSFNSAWFPWVFKYLSSKPSINLIIRYNFYILLIFLFLSLIFLAVCYSLVEPVLGAKFLNGRILLYGFVSAIFFQIIYWIFSPVIQYTKNNWILTYPIIPILLLSLILNLVFLSQYGILFASFVYSLSWFILASITIFYSIKITNGIQTV
ncbi:lipopolysaccharide biosynthesis protein [Algoriphagus sp. D3-2-R+10]|uniref:lipopolysaccharide biosynthesis protein n=1 Tax=Algoriphagus aurantiacus TaxID=3103948 RepID=UPI002B3FD33C|nr:lipopolysaccharide biosynthesis protein [Algoriphagus sp. D3-2-R+10]MEB2778412.1 lipopolysaccharide biosynthesis protein [Algoriphagus sp. D3-2-R+10]